VFSIRIAKGRSPFSPDRNHIHHLLLDRGLDHRYVTVSLVALNAALASMTYFSRSLGSTVLISLMIVITYSVIGLLYFTKRPASRLVIASSLKNGMPEPNVQPATKVVALNTEAAVASEQ
jgi:UDP-N-acetylmuramyl pentapeptide phosphotransferase/UDP-N-acetylglucosamine-1-phosphate transferase